MCQEIGRGAEGLSELWMMLWNGKHCVGTEKSKGSKRVKIDPQKAGEAMRAC